MRIRYKRTTGPTKLCERKPVVLLLLLGAAAMLALEWLLRGARAAAKSILGRWSREARPEAPAPDAGRDDASGDRPGWPGADEVEAALEDLRRRAA